MIRNLLAVLAGAVLLVLGFMASLMVFAVMAVLGLGIWGYVWWKTRELRRVMRERAPDARVIEGEAVVVEESSVVAVDALPGESPRQ